MVKQVLTLIALLYASAMFCAALAHDRPSNVNDSIGGILSYIRWDTHLDKIHFCIIDGTPTYITKDIFTPVSQPIKPPDVKLSYYSFDQLSKSADQRNQCNVFYFTKTPDDLQQQLIKQSKPKILTISENNPDCAIGSAFCIYKSSRLPKFKINLESLRNSQVKLDPRVLFLLQSKEEKE